MALTAMLDLSRDPDYAEVGLSSPLRVIEMCRGSDCCLTEIEATRPMPRGYLPCMAGGPSAGRPKATDLADRKL